MRKSIIISKEKLANMYYNMTIKDVAKNLRISGTLVMNYINKLGIKKKGRGGKRKLIIK